MSPSASNPNQTEPLLLAVDPGKDKWGYVIAPLSGKILEQGCLKQDAFEQKANVWKRRFSFHKIILGKGTSYRRFLSHLQSIAEVTLLDESFTTAYARKLYWQDHARRGLRHFIPASFQVPPEPYDDYAALALLKRYLAQSHSAICQSA